jgi:type IX secretion system PorP/SprF family membrane protein
VGIYYQVPGKYYLGLSVKNLLAAHSKEIMFTNARTVYAMGGYEYVPSSAPSIRIKPSALLKTANFSIFQADLSCLVDYRNAFWGGMGYRVQDAVYFLAGVHWKKLRIGLSYDITTSRLGTFKPGRSMGTLELYLKFCFKVVVPRKPNTVYGNTIYLD